MGFLADIVNFAVELMVWLIIIRVFLSYIPHNSSAPVWRFIYETTQPLLNLAARLLPMSLRTPLDFTPLLVLLLLQFLIRPLLVGMIASLF